jgi:predicted nicotinamide N-methyase
VQAEPAWVRGQTVLALGCGSGAAGIAALSAGVPRIVAYDIDPGALAIAAQHARANAVALLLQGTPLLHEPYSVSITCILVGDLFSERFTASARGAWLRTAPRRGAGSSSRTPETALRKRPASGLPRVRGTPHGKHARHQARADPLCGVCP